MREQLSIFLRRMHLADALTLAAPGFLSIPITLISVPICLSAIGVSSFGSLLIFFLIINHSHILLFGAEKNLVRKILKNSEFSSALLTTQCIVFLYGILIMLFLMLIFHFTKYQENLSFFKTEFFAFASAIPFHLLWSVQRSALQAHERFRALGFATFAYMAAAQYMPLAVAILFPGDSSVTYFLLAVLLARLLITSLLVPKTTAGVQRISLTVISKIFKLVNYGKWMGINHVLQILFDSADRYFLGLFHSSSAVALYSIPLQVSQKLVTIPIALSQIIFNKTSAPTDEKYENYFLDYAIMSPFIATAYFCVSRPFFELWLGLHATPVILELAVLTFVAVNITSLNFILTSIIEGLGNAHKISKYDSLTSLPLLGLTAFLVSAFGVNGAAMALICKEIVFFASRIKTLNPSTKFIKTSLATIIFLATSSTLAIGLSESYSNLLISETLVAAVWGLFIFYHKRLNLI